MPSRRPPPPEDRSAAERAVPDGRLRRGTPSAMTASAVRRLRAALDDQLDALGEPPFQGTDDEAAAACALAVLRSPEPQRPAVKAAVRATLAVLADRAPGNSLEVRVPPYGAVQAVEGPRHTRGTPPGVVETDPPTWLRLATGRTTWDEALSEHRVQASGARSDLSELLPLWSDHPPGGPDSDTRH